jgi:hypothetical protein
MKEAMYPALVAGYTSPMTENSSPRRLLAIAWNNPNATATQVAALQDKVNSAAPVDLPQRQRGESYAQAAMRTRRSR